MNIEDKKSELLNNIREFLPDLEQNLLYAKEDLAESFSDFYYKNSKLNPTILWGLQFVTTRIVKELQKLSNVPFSKKFEAIVEEGTGFELGDSQNEECDKKSILDTATHMVFLLQTFCDCAKVLRRCPVTFPPVEWRIVTGIYDWSTLEKSNENQRSKKDS